MDDFNLTDKLEFNFMFGRTVYIPSDIPPGEGEMSALGRVLFVKHELKTKFGFDVDKQEETPILT